MTEHLHSVIVSYNRLELTKQAIASYLATVSLPYTLVVVDNASTDGAAEWLWGETIRSAWCGYSILLLDENRFPGFATNRGWEEMPPQTTFLHRADNDFVFLPGWCEEMLRRFERREIGQVGLRTKREEPSSNNVGGNNVIRRQVWDEGVRYDERPWGEQYPPGWTEDSFFTPAIVAKGWSWARVKRPCIVPISSEDPNDPYYQETWALRGIEPPA